MSPRGKRSRLAKGVYRDAIGLSVIASVRGLRREVRLPADTPLQVAKESRRRLIRELEDTQPRTSAGSLAETVARYLDKLPDGPHKKDRRVLLTPWVTALGAHSFALLTREQLVTTIMGWEKAGTAPHTRNKRLSALRVLWRTVTTDMDTPHPCERLTRARPPKSRLDRARGLDLIELVLANVHDDKRQSHAKYQLDVLAWTGHPAALLRAVRPEHVRWHTDPPEVYLQPRRKGAGMDAAWTPLTPRGAAALKAWLKLGAPDAQWHKGVIAKAWKLAVSKTQTQLLAQAKKATARADKARLREDAAKLDGMRVYDLKHSFLTALGSLPGVDIHTVAEYARHADIRTSEIYMRGSSSVKVRSSIATLAATMPKGAKKAAGKVVAFGR